MLLGEIALRQLAHGRFGGTGPDWWNSAVARLDSWGNLM
jgi:hypothetical protein